ncbi:MAG: DUF4783 domain-containing protein [Prevotellaceae bacterium]|jgi:hypothetical protein|nr:DUF4783 domain-containing protein [Prevotellaceae bacterium]
MKTVANIKHIFTAAALLLLQSVCTAAVNPNIVTDIFKEISGELKSGDVDKLTAHFAATVELRILATGKTCSSKQAATLTKEFFSQHKPTNYVMLHIGSKANKHYGIGLLTTDNGRFRVTLFILIDETGSYTIQHFCIDHED